MSNDDPSIHRQLETQFIEHVERLLQDDRLRIDTTRGRRPVASFMLARNESDKAIDLRRLMSEMNRPDRDLEGRMPAGRVLEVTLAERRWFVFRAPVGRLRAICVSPTRALLSDQSAAPLGTAEVVKILTDAPAAVGGVPSTMVILSTSGFTMEARETAERRADRCVILVEPNAAGGWSVFGPAETKALVDLFDPESDDRKRQRIREEIEAQKADLAGAGAAADKIAAATSLSLSLVESELKSFAKANAGLAAKRLDGRLVLFRQGAAAAPVAGGSKMAFLDSVKALFARKGETEKKIALLSERRAALSQQRDAGYEEMGTLEAREAKMREEFKTASGDITRRRITSQLVQLRKDIERRQQLLSVLNQQINVVGTHLHNLELTHQGSSARLPDSEELASDAAAAEDVLARLQADNELADSVSGGVQGGMSDEEQALYEELMNEQAPAGGAKTPESAAPGAASSSNPPARSASAPQAGRAPAANPAAPQPRRSEPEAG
jgi:hypothetical protein